MALSRNAVEAAVAEAAGHLRQIVGDDEPGAVLLASSRGTPIASAVVGAAALEPPAPLTLRTAFDTGSVAKMVTGLAVAILEDEGSLSPSTPVRALLPELPAYADALRVGHLIHQESGLRSYFTLLYYMAGWHPRKSPSSDEVLRTLCRVGSLTFPPGSQYEYCDSNYFLLARIVERLSDTSFGTFVRQRVLEPLGMAGAACTDVGRPPECAVGYETYSLHLQSAYLRRSSDQAGRTWHPIVPEYVHVGAEGLLAGVQDLSRLAAHILRPTVVSERTMQERMLRPLRVREDGLGYGYGLNVGTYRARRFIGHDGRIWGYTASVAILPEDEVEIVCLTNRGDLGAWHVRSRILDALDGVPGKSAFRHAVCRGTPRVLGRYLDPATAQIVEIAETDGFQTITLGDSPPITVEQGSDGAWSGGGLTVDAASPCAGRQSIVVRDGNGAQRTFDRFVEHPCPRAVAECAGAYHCAELQTTFDIAATKTGIRLTNRDSRRPSMDLDYEPTRADFYWSHDPYPVLSQLQFLRHNDRIVAFVYRDPDGDRREDFRFEREPDQPGGVGSQAS